MNFHPLPANAYLKKSTFATYIFTPPPTPSYEDDDDEPDELDAPRCRFGLSLSTLLECLNIFGNAGGGAGASGKAGYEEEGGKPDAGGTTSLELKYSGEGEPLVIT